MGFLEKIGLKKKEKVEKGMKKTRSGLMGKIGKAIAGKDKVDAEVLDELEEILIRADVGVKTTIAIIERLEARVARDKYVSGDELQTMLREEVTALLKETSSNQPADFKAPFPTRPHIELIVGVNGVGKTTTIGKWMCWGMFSPTNDVLLI